MRELKINVSIHIEDSDKAGIFNVKARGAMQVAVLVETMRREGFELLVSRPTVIEKKGPNGERLEPYETVWIEVPDECVGTIMQNLANRKGRLTNMEKLAHSTMLEAAITTRGLIGLEIDVVNATLRPRRHLPPLQGIRPVRRRTPHPHHRHAHRDRGRRDHRLRPGHVPGARQALRQPRRASLRGHDRRRESPQ
jgi:hypothetical protein